MRIEMRANKKPGCGAGRSAIKEAFSHGISEHDGAVPGGPDNKSNNMKNSGSRHEDNTHVTLNQQLVLLIWVYIYYNSDCFVPLYFSERLDILLQCRLDGSR